MNTKVYLTIVLSVCMCVFASCNKSEQAPSTESEVTTFVIPIKDVVKSSDDDISLTVAVNCESREIFQIVLSDAALSLYGITQEEYNAMFMLQLEEIGFFDGSIDQVSTKASSGEVRSHLVENWRACGDDTKCKVKVAITFAAAIMDLVVGEDNEYPDCYK